MRALLVLLAILLAAGSADARKKKRSRAKLNMPPGWTWPPSAEMRAEGRVCLERLRALGVAFRKAPATRKVATPIYVPDMEIGGVKLTSLWRKGPFVMDCNLALALAERGADALRSAGVVELRFSSIHNYRNVAGTRMLSRHAIGTAMDVFQVVTVDGVAHVVERDYPNVVLLSVERWINESGAFRYLLTPGNDPRAHRDHFHFEARGAEERRRLTAL
jgi:hypothetical protein